MNDRKHLHPELLWSLEYERGSWVKHHPLLTPRASAVLAAVEKVMGEGTYCNGWTDCEACESRGMCSPELVAIAAAWKEHADG